MILEQEQLPQGPWARDERDMAAVAGYLQEYQADFINMYRDKYSIIRSTT